MFTKIFVFELQNAARRPAVYLYWLTLFAFSIIPFTTGALPLWEKEHINAPYAIAFWHAGMTMFMMVVSSSIMGMPLYRDIEYNTKDYYFTYPISKAGYFWGRFSGAFTIMMIIASALPLGIFLGTKLGPAMHWSDAARYGPNHFLFYLHPFLSFALPNLFFTAAIFFGLVAVTRNIKVIYSGGILLFMGYVLSQFFLNHTNNHSAIIIADPFGFNAIRFQSMNATSNLRNTAVINISGPLLINRIGFTALGLLILLYTYTKFSFAKFFSGRRESLSPEPNYIARKNTISAAPVARFTGNYNRQATFSLLKIELGNILKDNYFWIIVTAGIAFFGFNSWTGNTFYDIRVFPRTVTILRNFNEQLALLLFFIFLFYTGETIHRDKSTRYAYINDSLPPPNRVLNMSKLIALLIVAAGFALIPLVIGLPIQLLRGFHQFNFYGYGMGIVAVNLPRLLEMVALCYFLHVAINHKFAALAAGVAIWIGLYILHGTAGFNYNLLLYSYTPEIVISDMDGAGPTMKAVNWFNLYWILAASLLVIIAALLFVRGYSTGLQERRKLIPERFDKRTRVLFWLTLVCFLATAGWNYYNVSYLNEFLTRGELRERRALYEKTLKKYESLPLPKVTGLQVQADLFPSRREERVNALVTITNKNKESIKELLLDGDELSDYSIAYNGTVLPYSSPLLYSSGKMNIFRAKADTAPFRLYQLPKVLFPGDTMLLQLHSVVSSRGFGNEFEGDHLLNNGIFFNGGLPGLGYDKNDELWDQDIRKQFGLPIKKQEEFGQNDAKGTSNLESGDGVDLLQYDVTISTDADQQAVTSGMLTKQWVSAGRNYFHFKQDGPGMYAPLLILSARYDNYPDSVTVDGKNIPVNIFFTGQHGYNKRVFANDLKEGIQYYSKAFGNYPFSSANLTETSIHTPAAVSVSGITGLAEYRIWDADLSTTADVDYSYFEIAQQLALQWWRYQVAPAKTTGSMNISGGLAAYSAMMLMEKKFGMNSIKFLLYNKVNDYLFIRTRDDKERPLINANMWYEWNVKAGIVLYGLKDLIGEDSMNAALQEFRNQYAFKKDGPFAGSNNLYNCLQKHVPDSLQYYLEDNWKKITLYDNKIIAVTATPVVNSNDYKVSINCNIAKTQINAKGEDIAAHMQDYIDIGVFGEEKKGQNGQQLPNTLYLAKHKLSEGEHTIVIMVHGKPVRAGIDPYTKLIDHNINDNMKDIEH